MKNKTLQFRITERQYNLLKYLSKRAELTVSEYLRSAALPNLDQEQLINDIIEYERQKIK